MKGIFILFCIGIFLMYNFFFFFKGYFKSIDICSLLDGFFYSWNYIFLRGFFWNVFDEEF